MTRISLLCALLLAFHADRASAQITVTLGGPGTVAAANDYATTVFQDPWDMNERTDVGWFLNSVDQPMSGFSSATFAGGLFSGQVARDPNLWLLETGFPNLPPVGKTGNTFSIDANRFRFVAVRMRVSVPGYMLFFWSTNTIYDPPGLSTSGAFLTTPGWRTYIVDLASLPLLGGSEPWSGTKRSLRFDPMPDGATPGGVVDIDWIRLVEDQPALARTVSWTGAGGNVDLYLDNDRNPTNDPNQTLGLLAPNLSGSSYSLNAGALAPGTYYVAVRRANSNDAFAYSNTAYQVNAPALVQVTSPSDEGSADDFATTQLGNPWDMTSLSDIDLTYSVTNPAIVTISGAETESGAPLGDITAFFGTSTSGVFSSDPCQGYGDPVVYPFQSTYRGRTTRIDPARYRILTAELGVPNKPRDLCGGSVVRVVWQVAGEASNRENVSRDIPLNSRAGANVLNRINLDMANLLIDPGSPGQSGWVAGASAVPGISSFRIDPHEFPNPTGFYIKRIKLAALENANGSYTIRWAASKTGGTVRAYYDADRDPTVKTLIGSTLSASPQGSLAWTTTGLPQGEYHVYVEYDDGINTNGAYAKWPVVITQGPRLALNRTHLNFGVRSSGARTPPQTVRLTALDAPSGQPCWTIAEPELWFIQVTPRSGCGSALLTVSLLDQGYPWTGEFTGTIAITTSAGSAQFLRTTVRMNTPSSPPSGAVDTPANNAVVSGSVAVTGWAVDDLGVSRVTICRNAVAGEAAPSNPSCGAGQIYLGDAVSIDGARPDIEAYSPTTPLNYRAGWGFLVLTNMLPNQGNGAFVLRMHAFDVEGNRTELGARTISAQNASATAPFGAIDTPGQGETISGSAYANYGWVLSRDARADPPGGGSVVVYVDGLAVGSPGGWSARPDLSALFPTYPGVDRALGVFGLDTLAFGDGLHTIEWGVTDSAGRSSGVGSRYFTIFNGSSSSALAAGATRPPGADLGRTVDHLPAVAAGAAVSAREAFDLAGRLRPVNAGPDGQRRVSVTAPGLLQLRLAERAVADVSYAGYLVVNGRLRELPVGSSFDTSRGAFYWQPGLGHLGDFDLMFVRTQGQSRDRIPVRVTLAPRAEAAVASASTARAWRGVSFFSPARP